MKLTNSRKVGWRCAEDKIFWWNRFGPLLSKGINKKHIRKSSNWRWHIDEVFVKVNE